MPCSKMCTDLERNLFYQHRSNVTSRRASMQRKICEALGEAIYLRVVYNSIADGTTLELLQASGSLVTQREVVDILQLSRMKRMNG